MNHIRKYKILSLTIPLLLLITVSGYAQNIVQVVVESAEIYSDPELPTTYQIKAKNGDVFELESYGEEWFGIRMFSGEIRYLKSEDVDIEYDFFQEQVNSSKIIEICEDVNLIQVQASEKAHSKYSDDQISADKYENILIDRDVLKLFRNNDIPATSHTIFVDCINDSVVPNFDY